MKTYLRIVNPIVSLLVLLICLYSCTVDDGDFKPLMPIQGGIGAYFLAKGLFCSSALFILGKVLQNMLYGKPEGEDLESEDESLEKAR